MEGIGLERGGLCLGDVAIKDAMNKFLAQIKPPWHRKSCPALLCSRSTISRHLSTFLSASLGSQGEVTQQLL